MTKAEIEVFIERMEEIGDIWKAEDVERVYGNRTLDEALKDRMGDIYAFGNIIGTVLNAPEAPEQN